MSYDLYFHPKSRTPSPAEFATYFIRKFYTVVDSQATYENEDTGVYFQFEFGSRDDPELEDDSIASFNINFFRPSYFILEAEPEVSAFVEKFDLSVEDGQIDGMGTGDYDRQLLIRGWNKGNQFGARALPGGTPPNLPGAVLRHAWKWNRDRQTLQERLGDDIFVPLIMFFSHEGKPTTACAWTDGIPTLFPKVDRLILFRHELAPKKWFGKTEDSIAFVEWNAALPLLSEYGEEQDGEAIALTYSKRPKAVETFFRSAKEETRKIVRLRADQVLDSELVIGDG